MTGGTPPGGFAGEIRIPGAVGTAAVGATVAAAPAAAGAAGGPAGTSRAAAGTPGGPAAPGALVPGEDGFVLSAAGMSERTIAYRDLSLIAINGGTILLVAGEGADADHYLLERFGAASGPLVGLLRERRLRQRLADGFVRVPDESALDLVEYAAPAADGTTEAGIALLAFDPWGATLAPVDERRPVRRARRSDITDVTEVPLVGAVRVSAGPNSFEILRVGPATARMRHRFAALPQAAWRDMGGILAGLVPDLAPGAARRATDLLVDGRPASPDALGSAWEALEAAVLGEPTFAASYAGLRERAGGDHGLRWLAMAPVTPGDPSNHKAWFIVALPGNLVALELVTGGAHATYCFRVMPRAAYAGGVDVGAATGAVAGISASLVDARFLREPIALPDAQLRTPKGVRYRLALRALPSLALARANFVARLVHSSEEAWAAALDDLIAWHGACRDDAAVWPGRAAQEAQVADAAEGDG